MARLVYVGINDPREIRDDPSKGFIPILRDDWSLEDITETAKMMKVRLSKKKATQVMENIAKRFDAEIGINWDVIRCHIDMVTKGR